MTSHGGRRDTGLDLLDWVVRGERLGAGEIVVNSMDADGVKQMVRAVRERVSVPVVASGGAGAVDDFAPAVDAGADAVLAASVFHYREVSIAEVKAALRAAGHPVR